jgi:L-lactate dehydrogenase complex protein LldG
MALDSVLQRVRSALGRTAGQPVEAPPDLYWHAPVLSIQERIQAFTIALEALAGKVFLARNRREACEYVTATVARHTAIASNSTYLVDVGICGIAEVQSGITDREEMRALCASADFGITSADYALANTGTLVMIASASEQRLVSLLPPVHIAVVPCSRLLTSLDELLLAVPKPADQSSSMVLITGPSRTADIEQILVRGVHGPGNVHVVLVETD